MEVRHKTDITQKTTGHQQADDLIKRTHHPMQISPLPTQR